MARYRDNSRTIVEKRHGISVSHITVRRILTGDHYDFVHQEN